MKKFITLILSLVLLLQVKLQAQNNALKFGNTNPINYVLIPYDSSYNFGTGPFTFEAQIKVPNVSNDQTIVSTRNVASTTHGYWIYINTSGKLSFNLGGFTLTSGIGNDLRDNNCHHIALRRNSSGILSVFIDGVFYNSYQVTNDLTPFGVSVGGQPTWLGRENYNTSGSPFQGMMDEIRFWKTDRSNSEIDLFKNDTVIANSTGLKLYYKCNQGIAGGNNSGVNLLTNSSSSNFNGLLQNFTLTGTASNFVEGCNSNCVAFAGNDTTICTTNTIILNPSPPGGTYTDNSTMLSGLVYTGVSPGLRTLIYTSPAGCRDTMLLIIRLKPNLGPDISICKNDSMVFPAQNPAYQVSYTVNGNSMTNVFYGNTVGTFTISANASGCRDTLVITVKDTCNPPPGNICQYFTTAIIDTNCCSAGITRVFQGGPNVVSVGYHISGGVIQNYNTNCTGGLPASHTLSGTNNGLITFNPACGNLQFFHTSLQSTTSTGTMNVFYNVKFANGDSCRYSFKVDGCERAPQTQCDKFKIKNLSIQFPFITFKYLNIKITNNAAPASPICNVIFTKYSTTNSIEPNFFLWANRATAPSQNHPSPVSNVSVFPAVVINSGGVLTYNLIYPGNVTFAGYIEVTVIHCNGDTCKYKWTPKVFNPSEATYLDYTINKAVNPYTKMYAYSLKLKGPTQIPMGDNPYKIGYISLIIPDTGNAEIAACTGADMLYDAENKINKVKTSLSEHSRKYALFELAEPLELQPRDSSGILQIIFGNSLPNNIYYNFYDEEGNIMNGGSLTLDSAATVGVTKLGKTQQFNEPMLFNAYPNPSSGHIDCKISIPQNDLVILRVLNIEGKEVYRKDIGSVKPGLADLTIDLSHLENGNYLINAECKNTGMMSNSIKVIIIK